jgi:hypothetical protein
MRILSTFRRLGAPALAAATIAVTLPGIAFAQACLGSSALPGQLSLGGGVAFQDSATGYMLGTRANFHGPIGLGAEIGIIDVDNVDRNATVIALDGSWDLPVEGLAVCPVAGMSLGMWSDSFDGATLDVTTAGLPVGFSVGARVGEPDAAAVLLPHARAGLWYQRVTVKVSEGNLSVSGSDSDTLFFFGGGMTMGLGQFYGNVGVAKTTGEDSEAVLSVGLGIVF